MANEDVLTLEQMSDASTNASCFKEIMTSDAMMTTSVASDGKQKVTIASLAAQNDSATASAAAAAVSETNAVAADISSGTHEANAAASASSAASSATSTGTALAQANAILGLGIGTSCINSDGDLVMTYDDGTVTVPPYINSNGEFIVEY